MKTDFKARDVSSCGCAPSIGKAEGGELQWHHLSLILSTRGEELVAPRRHCVWRWHVCGLARSMYRVASALRMSSG